MVMIWGVYLRLSKQDARGGKVSEANSIQGQRRFCRDYISRIDPDAVIVEFAEAEFISASQGLNRPAYKRMLDAIASGELNHIVARDQDRFTRDRDTEFGELKKLCKLAGVSVHTTDSGELFGSVESELASGIRSEFGQFYARVLGANTKKGLRTRREAGEWVKPGLCFGYEKGGVINRQQAEHIRWAYDQILNGKSLRYVMETWNATGVLTASGGQWYSPNRVQRTLLAPVLAGKVTYNGKWLRDVTAKWEPIVTPEEQDQLQSVISRNQTRERGYGERKARRYMLAGKALCGKPECDLRTMVTINPGKRQYHYYSHARRVNGCGNYTIGPEIEKLASLVAAHLLTRTTGPAVTDYDDSEIRDIELQLAEVRASMVSGDLRMSDAKPVLDGLNARLDLEHERKRQHEESEAAAVSWHEDLIDKIIDGDQDAIRTVIDSVVVLPDKAGFTFTGTNGVEIPVHPVGDEWRIDLRNLRERPREAPLTRVGSFDVRIVRR